MVIKKKSAPVIAFTCVVEQLLCNNNTEKHAIN